MSDNRKEVHDALAGNKIIPVVGTGNLKGKDDAVALARALHAGGCNVIEFVLRSANAEDIVNTEVFTAIREACPGMRIGVGTCLMPEDVELAKKVGADFAVSAGFSWRNVEKASDLGIFYLPGVGEHGHLTRLITNEEVSPKSGRTVQDLLGGEGVATLKLHPNGATDLADVLEGTVQNPYQATKARFVPVGFEPSELMQKDWGLKEIGEFARKPQVTMLGGTFPYAIPDGSGGVRDLIKEQNWEGITALTRYAMDVTHGREPEPLPEDVNLAAAKPSARIAKF